MTLTYPTLQKGIRILKMTQINEQPLQSRKLPEDLGRNAPISCFGKQEKKCKTFLNHLIIFSIVQREIFDSTDPLLSQSMTKSLWSSCSSLSKFYITAFGKVNGEPINSGDTVSLSSVAYGSSYRLRCLLSFHHFY